MATRPPREHIEEIRRSKFSIGKEMNPLTEDLHQAVKIFSAELYAKDVHFLMELIQNAEDNQYPEGVDPSLEFVVTSRDITGTGSSSTLLIFNNEKGFSPNNIDSICSVGRSTKKGNRKRGYIGEKGIGFKSVFLITSRPYIFSNGYQLRFHEEPCSHCNVGYIVPEWVDENPILSDVKRIYGSGRAVPTTVMVLPLKPDKVEAVKQQLSSIHPEVLLFLSKIKKLSVKEDSEDPKLSTLSAIAISSEVDFMKRKNIDAESYTLHLSTGETADNFDKECRYYMWRQRFPVKREHVVERRAEVDEWLITLAFPYGERLHRGTDSPGVYAYLPTEMFTDFPFIIQADFLLASSRETILFDSKWNQGILGCVPSAFISAFRSLVVESEGIPMFNLPNMFAFLPIKSSPHPQLNIVRDAIRSMLVEENIVPRESYTDQRCFHKPREVSRLMPSFWSILHKSRAQGVNFHNLSSHGTYILSSSFDKAEYDHILNFMGVEPVDSEWYAKCIRNSNLVMGVSEDVYLELLDFLAQNWSCRFHKTSIRKIPLLKYVDINLNISLCSISEVQGGNGLFLASHSGYISWLIDWNHELKCVAGSVSIPRATQKAIHSYNHKEMLLNWLKNQVKVACYGVYDFADLISRSVHGQRELAIAFFQFLYHSSKGYLSEAAVHELCLQMPLVDNNGNITTQRTHVLVPANGSKWTGLIGSNPWRAEGYVELGEDYLRSGSFAGKLTAAKELIPFVKKHIGASDIPNLAPPNAALPTCSTSLTKKNAFLLLDWIRWMSLRYTRFPDVFLSSIKNGSWLRVSLSGNHTYKPPSLSFLVTSSWGDLLQHGSVLVDVPVIDQGFYDNKIQEYKEELRIIGVKFEFEEACQYIGKRLMKLAASSTLTRSNVFSVLNFIKHLRSKMLSVKDFVTSVQKERWLRTRNGDQPPVDSVLFDQGWKAAEKISAIPFIDEDHYGREICNFKDELELLGVLVGFNKNYELVADNLKESSYMDLSSAEALLLFLKCIRHSGSADRLIKAVQHKKCLWTNFGYKSPGDCFLSNPKWDGLLQVLEYFPVIDQGFYGECIFEFESELKQLGVLVEFEDTCRKFADRFKMLAPYHSIRKEHVLSFLKWYRQLGSKLANLPEELQLCMKGEKWLRTRLGNYVSPSECILSGPDWEPISQISLLPFLDDGEKYYDKDIHEYKAELKSLGVCIEFEHGASFVTEGISFPQNAASIASGSVLSLLECIRIMWPQWVGTLQSKLEFFKEKVSQNWVKTNFGYLAPNKAMLFGKEWADLLQKSDGPFIDEEFYGSSIVTYEKELSAIGVTVDVSRGCALLARYLHNHSHYTSIVRIYNYLKKFNWNPEEDNAASRKVWIPETSEKGKWASPEDCVLYDEDGLFGSQLNVLDMHYDKKLLNFFASALKVKSDPSLDDYCRLWKEWEFSGEKQLSQTKCCAFWVKVCRNWNSKTQKYLAENLVKIPTDSGTGEIWMGHKPDVFIADDLHLKDLFQQSSSQPLFVWYPRKSLASLSRTKLLEIYGEIGVKSITEAVQIEESSIADISKWKKLNAAEILRKEMFVLILGFLAGPSIRMEVEKRHEAVQRLLKLSVFETEEPILVKYSLPLSSGEVVIVRTSRMIHWDGENSELFIQKDDRSGGPRSVIEFGTYFSKVVSEGLLWDKEDYIEDLSELIKLAFVLDFDEEAVGFLMKDKFLQIYDEDQEFLSSAFPGKQAGDDRSC